MQSRILILTFLLCTLVPLLAGCDDHQTAVMEHERYVVMVCDGVWPDYKGLLPECDQ